MEEGGGWRGREGSGKGKESIGEKVSKWREAVGLLKQKLRRFGEWDDRIGSVWIIAGSCIDLTPQPHSHLFPMRRHPLWEVHERYRSVS